MGEIEKVIQADTQYEEYAIREVRKLEHGGWELNCEDALGFFCPEDAPIEPKPGMIVRFYGKGLGYVVRGITIDGHVVFYRTEAQQEEKNREESNRKRREQFELERESIDARVAALPEIFRKRLDKFRRNNPDFRWKYESYELFCCEQAVEIANALVTADAIKEFSRKKYEEQKTAVPALSGEHSGNTFGCAVQLAYLYLSQPEAVEAMHGALAPLVGSEEYGCVSKAA